MCLRSPHGTRGHQIFSHYPFRKRMCVCVLLTALGLCCCAWALFSCSGHSLVAVPASLFAVGYLGFGLSFPDN